MPGKKSRERQKYRQRQAIKHMSCYYCGRTRKENIACVLCGKHTCPKHMTKHGEDCNTTKEATK